MEAKAIKKRGRPKGSKHKKAYLVLTARDAIAKIGEQADPFIYMAKQIAANNENSLACARHLSTFIEPQIQRTEISGPDSNALTINFNFDAMPAMTLRKDGNDTMIDVTPTLSNDSDEDDNT